MKQYNNLPHNILKDWTILVIDDHVDSRDIISIILSNYGANVIVAKDGQEGFEAALKHLPKFIISDISMPNVDGWELVELLKNDPRTQNISVIALTAHASTEDRTRAFSKGFHNYLSKPLKPFTFISQILVLLETVDDLADDLQRRLAGDDLADLETNSSD